MGERCPFSIALAGQWFVPKYSGDRGIRQGRFGQVAVTILRWAEVVDGRLGEKLRSARADMAGLHEIDLYASNLRIFWVRFK